jgi:hypothetical protein
MTLSILAFTMSILAFTLSTLAFTLSILLDHLVVLGEIISPSKEALIRARVSSPRA